MNIQNLPNIKVGNVSVSTTNNRGFTPEEVAQRCTDKLLNIADSTPPAIRDQAIAYKKSMEAVIALYMKEAIKTDRTTVYNAIKDAGQPKLAEYIRKM